MQLFVVASGDTGIDEPTLVGALGVATDAFPQLDAGTTRSWRSHAGRLLAASVHHAVSVARPRRSRAERTGEVVFYDGLPVSRGDQFHAHDADELLARWPGLEECIDGQFVTVRLDLERERADLICDMLGLVQVFAVPAGRGILASNSVEALRAAVGLNDPDPRGLATFLSIGWAVDDRCLLSGPRRLSGGCRHTLAGGRLRSIEYATLRGSAEAGRGRSTAEVARRLEELTRGALRASKAVRSGLTGGRDSRVVAALAVRGDADIEYYTSGRPGDIDVQIGQRLAAELGVPWRMINPPLPVEAEPADLTLRFVRQTDGLASVSRVSDQFDLPGAIDTLGLKLSGTGGELARLNGSPLRALMTVLPGIRGSGALQSAVLERSATRGELLRSATVHEAQVFLRDFSAARIAEGWPAADLWHAFYVHERISRWTAPTYRAAAPAYDVFSPLCTREYSEYALALTPQERFVDASSWGLLSVLAPALRKVPYESPTRPRRPRAVVWIASAEAARAFIGTRAPAPSGPAARPLEHLWFERLVPIVRDLAAAYPNSPLWEFVNREHMTDLLDGGYERWAGDAATLQRVATAMFSLHGASVRDRVWPRH